MKAVFSLYEYTQLLNLNNTTLKNLATLYTVLCTILKLLVVFLTAEQKDTLLFAKFKTRASLQSYDNAWRMTSTSNIHWSIFHQIKDMDFNFIHLGLS